MARVRLFIPASLRSLTDGTQQFDVEAGTVRAAIEVVSEQYPKLLDRLIENDALRPGLAVAIDSRIHSHGLLEPLHDGCELHFVPAVSGG